MEPLAKKFKSYALANGYKIDTGVGFGYRVSAGIGTNQSQTIFATAYEIV